MKTKYLLPLLLLLLFNVIGGAAQNSKADKPKRTVMLGQIVKDSFTGVRLKAPCHIDASGQYGGRHNYLPRMAR